MRKNSEEDGQMVGNVTNQLLAKLQNKSLANATSESEPATLREAGKWAAQLIGFFPQGRPPDMDFYVRGVTAMFASYSRETCMRVVHPVTGLPSRMKFLPSLSELRSALDALGPSEAVKRLDADRERQLRERQETDEWERQNPAAHRKAVVDRHWRTGERGSNGEKLPDFKGWQERAKSFGQVNHTGEELMTMGLFAPENEGTRW